MTSPFPLLRLPGVVLCEVFKLLNIGEKIKLSLCSKKISTQINNASLYSQKVLVALDILNQKLKVHSENNNDSLEMCICPNYGMCNDYNSIKIEGLAVSVTSSSKGITSFWKNHREGFQSVIRHLSKMFQCKLSADINFYICNLFQLKISELFNLQLEFKTLTIRLNGSKDQNWLWNQISSNFGLVEYLRIFTIVNPAFTPVFTSWPQKISIRSSYWFTLESLLACTSTTITLEDSLLGNKDTDEILQKWKTGGFPNLQRLEIQSRNITSFGATILGMNLRELDGMVIQTDDGSKKATIKIDFQSLEMYVTPFE